ncbi:MAG: (Fe-S)-binding protein [Dehalococcoidia bacterium]|nr:(Fe-S)-binding protein [Dehalococcoidia bacterium]
MDAASLSRLYDRKKQQIVEDCNYCGICVEVCPAIPLSPLASLPASEIQEKVIAVLKNGTMSDEASLRAAGCMHCAKCRDLCPLDINPVTVQELLQLELVKLGQKRYPLMEIKLGDRNLFVPDILASMQVRPEEKDWITHVPDKPQHRDVVVFAGCAMVMMPDKIFLVRDILRRLGLDFVIVAGGELCCGARCLGVDLDKVDDHAKNLYRALAAFQPERVIFCCSECAGRITQYDREISPAPFTYEEIYHFLSRHINELGLNCQINKKITLHDPCSLSRVIGDNISLRTILKAIPGLEFIEMDSNKEESICCGAVVGRKKREVGHAMAAKVMQEAARTGADVLVDACQGCHFQFCPEESGYPFKIENLLTIIGEAMGISYEDKLKKFYHYGNIERIMSETGECVEAGPYDPGFTALLAQHIFTRPAR